MEHRQRHEVSQELSAHQHTHGYQGQVSVTTVNPPTYAWLLGIGQYFTRRAVLMVRSVLENLEFDFSFPSTLEIFSNLTQCSRMFLCNNELSLKFRYFGRTLALNRVGNFTFLTTV